MEQERARIELLQRMDTVALEAKPESPAVRQRKPSDHGLADHREGGGAAAVDGASPDEPAVVNPRLAAARRQHLLSIGKRQRQFLDIRLERIDRRADGVAT